MVPAAAIALGISTLISRNLVTVRDDARSYPYPY